MPITAVRPGNSSGLMPNRPSQKKVFDRPSKDTDDRASSRKAMPLSGSGSAVEQLGARPAEVEPAVFVALDEGEARHHREEDRQEFAAAGSSRGSRTPAWQ